MKYLIQIICIIVAVANSACAKKIFVPITKTYKIIDTVTIEKNDSAYIEALFFCDRDNKVKIQKINQLKGELANQKIAFDSGKLTVNTKWKTKFIDRNIISKDTITVVDKQIVNKIVYQYNTIFWICAAISLLSVVYIIMRVVLKLKK